MCLVADVQNGHLKAVDDQCEIVRLGENVRQAGAFSEGALQRAEDCLKIFKRNIEKFRVEKIAAVATSAARDVANGHKLLDIGKRFSIPIQIIEGKKEADYTFNGVLSGQDQNKDFVVVDIGGGSTEFAFLKNNKIELTSLDLGCVRHTEAYLNQDVSSKEQIDKFMSNVRKELEGVEVPARKEIIAVAGTPTTLACVKEKKKFDPAWVENSVLTVSELLHMEQTFNSMTLEERKKIPGMEPKRADVILSGCIILRMITEKFGKPSVRVSTRGVRYGLALEMGSK